MRMQIFRIILAFMIAATFAFASAAYAGGGGKYVANFEDLDTNNDQSVTKDEFTSHFKDNADPAGAFSIIDRDSNDSLDHEEWGAFMKIHGHGSNMNKGDANCTMSPHKGDGQSHMYDAPHGKKSE